MEAGKAITSDGVSPPGGRGWSRTFGILNPLRAVWWLFTNVRFAIVLLAVLVAVSLVGVVLPQAPANVRGDAIAEADWLRVQEGRYGFLTDSMDRAGLFDVFHARWFAVLMSITVASTGAYVLSRAPGIWAAVTRPRKRVPDRYFDVARNRVHATSGIDPLELESRLRRARYRVETFPEPGVTYVFADRFQWAQLGTLLTHIAVIVFILSAVVSRVDAFSSPLFLAEGSTLPVFSAADRREMQLELLDAKAAFAPDGRPLDYRSRFAVYERGEVVKTCESTVNSPCAYNGYHFYQSAYFGFGAAVQVRDTATGNAVYLETLGLSDAWPSPRVQVRDAQGTLLFDGALVLTNNLEADGVVYSGTIVELAGGRVLTVGLRAPSGGGEPELAVFEPSGSAGLAHLILREGATGESGGLTVSYLRAGTVPAALVPDFPIPASANEGATGSAFLQMSNVVYGTGTVSEGTSVETPAAGGPPQLTIVGLGPEAMKLEPGEHAVAGGLEYTFLGQREFSGITVKRDRSDYFVWIGASLIVIGLMITFWVPRRRFWAKITAADTWFAGQAASHADYTRELRRMAREAGASIPERTDDDD